MTHYADTTNPPPAAERDEPPRDPLRAHGFLWLGIAVAVLGFLALLFPPISTFAVTIIVGVSLAAAGALKAFQAFQSRRGMKIATRLLWALVYIVGGALILFSPWAGAWSITIILAGLLLAGGVLAIIWSLRERPRGWAWMLASGVISIALAGLVLWSLPTSALIIPGIVVGVDLITTAFALLAMDRIERRGVSGLSLKG